MHPLERAFGIVLRRRREASGLSQEALASAAALHRNYVGLLERSKRLPTILVVHRIAQALETTMSQLLREVEKELAKNAKTSQSRQKPQDSG